MEKLPWRAFHHFWMSAGSGQAQTQVGVHGHVLVFRVLGRPGLEPLGLLAVEVLVGDVRPGDQAERLAGDPGELGDLHLVDQERNGLGIGEGPGGDDGDPLLPQFLDQPS